MKNIILFILLLGVNLGVYSQITNNNKEVENITVEFIDPDLKYIDGKGNSTFNDSPNTLARIFTKNATVESIIATFPKYSANSAEDNYTDRRTRIFHMGINREHRVVTLEYNAKTRKLKTIIIDIYSPDRYKQKLINAGYNWNSKSSITATSFGHGYRSYWQKNGNRVGFVFDDNVVKIFRVD